MKRGFMCQSTAAAVVCTTDDPRRSVVVPRKLYNVRTLVEDSSRTRLIPPSAAASGFIVGDHASVPKPLLPRNPGTVTRYQTRLMRQGHQVKKPESKPETSSLQVSSSSDNVFQVVVMRVSLHCQGCAGKVKKHLSKMEGVTSFSIDLETKMVTVRGNVSPVGVLESVSKVKRAEFWPC